MISRKITSILMSAACALLLAPSVWGQAVRVSGVVTDESGEPIVGAAVYDKGDKTSGVMTDSDGRYSLTVAGRGTTLVFSILGYEEVEERVGKRSVIDVVMREDALTLESAEVVAVGYGTVARRDLTGSVAKVDMDDIIRSTPQNFDQAISGRVAGVVVTSPDGAVGSTASITIRGNNSLTQSSEPLYVIDGFPSESSMAAAINPADIESFDVLKDASATAIYGARGANGVIVITTKKGTEGRPKVNFSSSLTMNVITKKMELLDAYGFVEMMSDYYEKVDYGSSGSNIYFAGLDEDGVRNYHTYTLEDYRDIPQVNWQDLMYRNSLTQNYNLTLSGGNKSSGTRYNFSLGHINQDGIIINSNYKRYSFKFTINQKITEDLTLDATANFSRNITSGATPSSATNSGGASSYLMYSVWGYRPVKPIIFGYVDDAFINSIVDEGEISDDGTVEVDINDTRFNPVASARNEVRTNTQDYMSLNAALNWNILPELVLRVSGGYTFNNRRREEFNNSQTSTGYAKSWSGWGINGSFYNTNTSDWLEENTLTWTKTYNDTHHLQVLGGVTFQGEDQDYSGARAIQLATEQEGINALYTGTYLSVWPSSYGWTLMSFLSRVNYNYAYKYYLTASFRSDGSSKFPKANRWGFFPSASAAWNFNRENLLKDSRWLSNGKLRLSWGLTGNNRTSTPYDYYAQYTRLVDDWNTLDYVNDNVIVPGYYPSNMSNDDLKWETTEQTDLGIDLGLFKNRIKVTADVYVKHTRDLLLRATIPATSGYKSQMVNIGSMRNRGVELTLDLVPVQTRRFTWTSSFNIARNQNTVTSLVDTQHSLLSTVSFENNFNAQYAYITQAGRPTGMMYGFIYDGTYKEDDFNNGITLKEGVPHLSSVAASSMRPGDPRYRDINGDGVIDDNDRTIIGCGQPDFTGGWNNSFNIGAFDLSVFFNWSVGNDILNANRLIFENPYSRNQLNQFATVRNRYSSRNPTSDIPAVYAQGMYVYSSRVIEDGSFLRLKNAAIGYTIPSKTCKRLGIDHCRVYVSADNLWTLTNYSGQDPEVSTKNSVLTPGFDWSAYSRATGYTAGLSITF